MAVYDLHKVTRVRPICSKIEFQTSYFSEIVEILQQYTKFLNRHILKIGQK